MQASEALSELGFPLWLSAALGGSLAGYSKVLLNNTSWLYLLLDLVSVGGGRAQWIFGRLSA